MNNLEATYRVYESIGNHSVVVIEGTHEECTDYMIYEANQAVLMTTAHEDINNERLYEDNFALQLSYYNLEEV